MRFQRPLVLILSLGATVAFSASCFASSCSGRAEVVAIEKSLTADVVILNCGSASGFRQGMTCEILRGPVTVGSVLVVELRKTASAALISTLNSGQVLNAGDLIEVKILKTQVIASNL